MSAPVITNAATEVLRIDRGQSPWLDYTASADEEARGKHIAAVVIEPSYERPKQLQRFVVGGGARGDEPLLAIDRAGRRVVVNRRVFTNLDRVDATRIGKDETAVLGRVIDPSFYTRGRELATFLLLGELVQTYAHIGSKLTLIEERDTATHYVVRVTGSHVYFTNHRNESRLDFSLTLDKQNGELRVSGK